MFTSQYQRLDILQPDNTSLQLLEELMGNDVTKRKDFIFKNVDFSTVHE
jgi:hypothetical protein